MVDTYTWYKKMGMKYLLFISKPYQQFALALITARNIHTSPGNVKLSKVKIDIKI